MEQCYGPGPTLGIRLLVAGFRGDRQRHEGSTADGNRRSTVPAVMSRSSSSDPSIRGDGVRQCSRTGCSDRASVTLTYQYSRSQVWLDDLTAERDPHGYDMCPATPVDCRPRRAGTSSTAAAHSPPSPASPADPPPLARSAWLVVSRPSLRPAQRIGMRPVDPVVAVVAWLVAFFVGQTLSTIVLMAAGVDDAETASIPTLFAAVIAAWVAYLVGAWWASQRSGTGSMIRDYAISGARRRSGGHPHRCRHPTGARTAAVRRARPPRARHVHRGSTDRERREPDRSS